MRSLNRFSTVRWSNARTAQHGDRSATCLLAPLAQLADPGKPFQGSAAAGSQPQNEHRPAGAATHLRRCGLEPL